MKVLKILAVAWILKAIAIILASLFFVSCAGRVETMQYTSDTLPSWILAEWRNAQDELLELEPPVPTDPRRFSPYMFDWIQLEKPFWHVTNEVREPVYGLTRYDSREIIICCGRRETVRHEAFHAILYEMRDPRHELHYPELKEE